MKTYYLVVRGARRIITNELRGGEKWEMQVEATSWLAAKDQMGLDLSPAQIQTLEARGEATL